MSEWREVPFKIADRIGDFAIYAITRCVILCPLVIARSIEHGSLGVAKLARMFANSYQKLLIVYDSLPYGAIQLKTIEATSTPINETIKPMNLLQVLNDPSEDKELMILGTKGSGKSTIAQYLAYSMSGHIRVYEPEGTPWDWRGLEVLGKGENWKEIEQGMRDDLEHLSAQLLIRREQGDEALTGSDRVVIGEEYPEIASKVDCSEEWLERHARRGRKAKVRLILLSQFDQVSAWNMEGKLQLLACFYRLRLTKMARQHAIKIKRPELALWIDQSRSHALLDDVPVLIPSYEDMKRVVSQGLRSFPQAPSQIQSSSTLVLNPSRDEYEKTSEKTSETDSQSGFQPPKTSFSQTSIDADIELLSQIVGAITQGRSDDWISKNVLMERQRISYYKAKEKVSEIREKITHL